VDKRQIVAEAVQPSASLSEVARRYGIAARVLFRWKQELTATPALLFVAVQIGEVLKLLEKGLGCTLA
jgi:transposase-like protein